MSFPNEQSIPPHRLIKHAESAVFTDLDDDLDNCGYNETRDHFDFTEILTPTGAHVIARPHPGVQQKIWVQNSQDSTWYEDAAVDAAGNVMLSPAAVAASTPVTGNCSSCGVSTMLPNGGTALFCPSCGTKQTTIAVPLIPAHMPVGTAVPAVQPSGYDPNRMTGSQKAPVEIPEGLGKTTGEDEFFAFLDKAVEAGQEDPQSAPAEEGPAGGTDVPS